MNRTMLNSKIHRSAVTDRDLHSGEIKANGAAARLVLATLLTEAH